MIHSLDFVDTLLETSNKLCVINAFVGNNVLCIIFTCGSHVGQGEQLQPRGPGLHSDSEARWVYSVYNLGVRCLNGPKHYLVYKDDNVLLN